jgi:peptidoglycan/xylan/chitin deacetylase (PgdA/CDA1 family)
MWTLSLPRLRAGGTVLCFHSVTSAGAPAAGAAHVSMDAFASFMQVARRFGEFVPLSELVDRNARGQSTSGLIALTFDDAYTAVRDQVAAFAARHRIPFSVFVVADAAATGATYWWDRVDDAFPRVTPERWRAFETACGLPDAYRSGQPREHGPLRPLRQWLLAAFAGRWPDRFEPALQALEHDAGWRTQHRSMTFDELADLARMPLVEIGVHTRSHPVLPLLTDDALTHEITGCFDVLRERLGVVRPILAIPFGLYDRRTLRAARSAGLSCVTLGDQPLDRAAPDAVPRFCLCNTDTARSLALRLFRFKHVMRPWSHRGEHLYPALPSPTT